MTRFLIPLAFIGIAAMLLLLGPAKSQSITPAQYRHYFQIGKQGCTMPGPTSLGGINAWHRFITSTLYPTHQLPPEEQQALTAGCQAANGGTHQQHEVIGDG